MQGDSSSDAHTLPAHTHTLPAHTRQRLECPTTTAVNIWTCVSPCDKDDTHVLPIVQRLVIGSFTVGVDSVVLFSNGTDQLCCQDNRAIRSLLLTA